MPKTLMKSGLHSNKNKLKFKQEKNNTKSNLPPNIQSIKQKSISGNCFLKYNQFIIYRSLIQTIQIKILDVLVGFCTL